MTKILKLNNFNLGNLSKSRLNKVDPKVIKLVERALELTVVDFGIAYMGGWREAAEQFKLFEQGFSTKDGTKKKSKHQLGLAIDFLPYVNGQVDMNRHNYYLIITSFFIAAKELEYKIRSGSNWDSDNEFTTDQTFNDLPHIELME